MMSAAKTKQECIQCGVNPTCSLDALTAMASAAVAEWMWGVMREVTFMPMFTGDWGEPGRSIPSPSLSLDASCGRQDWPGGGWDAGVRMCGCMQEQGTIATYKPPASVCMDVWLGMGVC